MSIFIIKFIKKMENQDKEPRINIEQVNNEVHTLVSQLGKIEERKWNILKLLNKTWEIIKIFRKMKAGKIISLRDTKVMNDFIQNGDIKIWESDKWIFFEGILDWDTQTSYLAKFIEQYPLVVDADEIDEDNAEWWLITVIKDEMTMFIQIIKDDEWVPSIIYCSDAYEWVVSLPKDDPDNKKFIQVGQPRKDKTIFLQKEVDPSWVCHITKIADLDGECNGEFDKDNLAVLYKKNSMFSIIHKSELINWKFQVEEVLTFKRSSRVDVMFDRYNCFEAKSDDIGKVVCKKRYNEWWEFIWIDVFKKLRLGGERIIHNNCRWIKKNENPFTR